MHISLSIVDFIKKERKRARERDRERNRYRERQQETERQKERERHEMVKTQKQYYLRNMRSAYFHMNRR